MPEKIVKSRERVSKFAEVYTPAWLVSDMCDLVKADIADPAKTVLEPSCGNGNFLVEILARKLQHCQDDKARLRACKNIYGVDIQADNIKECHARLLGLLPEALRKKAARIFKRNIVQGDFLKPETIWFLEDLHE